MAAVYRHRLPVGRHWAAVIDKHNSQSCMRNRCQENPPPPPPPAPSRLVAPCLEIQLVLMWRCASTRPHALPDWPDQASQMVAPENRLLEVLLSDVAQWNVKCPQPCMDESTPIMWRTPGVPEVLWSLGSGQDRKKREGGGGGGGGVNCRGDITVLWSQRKK